MSRPMNTQRLVVRDDVVETRVVITVGPVDVNPLGSFGWFLGVRNRRKDQAIEARDRSRYGICVICRRKLVDDEQIHMVFNVQRNDKVVGNRLCCSPCAEKHGTFSYAKAAAERRADV